MAVEGIDFSIAIAFFISAAGMYVSNRLKLPLPIILIVFGLFFGPALLGILESTDLISLLATVGIILLLFKVGLESDLALLKTRGSWLVGVLGFVTPWVAGYLTAIVLGISVTESVFVGVILTATSVGITVAILREYGVMDREYSRIILGAAVIDDVLGLMGLSLAYPLAQYGYVVPTELMKTIAISLLFILLLVALGSRVIYHGMHYMGTKLSQSTQYLGILAFCFLVAAMANEIGLAAMVGSFLAGLSISDFFSRIERKSSSQPHPIPPGDRQRLEERVDELVFVFTPMFFLDLGLMIEREDLIGGLLLGLVLTGVGIVSKYYGSYLGSIISGLNRKDADIIGTGMIPRGEIGLVAAQIGLVSGILSPSLFSAVVVMAILTSIIPPLLLHRKIFPHSEGY